MVSLSSKDVITSLEYVNIVLAKVEQMLMHQFDCQVSVFYYDGAVTPSFMVKMTHKSPNSLFTRGSCTRVLEIKHIIDYNDEELITTYFNEFEDYLRNAYGNLKWYSMTP